MSTVNRELVFNRLLQAPRELVFDAWTDPEHLSKWYGPEGFSLTTHHMDLRPGGQWSYTMHGPDGRDYRNKMVFLEIERPRRLVYEHVKEAGTEPVGHQMIISFEQEGDKTRLTMHLLFESPAALEMVARNYGAVEGGNQTLTRLERWLAVLTNPLLKISDNQIVSTRLFDVTQGQMFKAWTDPGILSQWWGPDGFTNTFHEFDLRPGGSWKFIMHGPGGDNYPNECIFIAVTEPLQLIWRHISAHEFYGIANFEAEFGKTRVIFKMIFDSAEECKKVRRFIMDANEQNFDRLERELGAMMAV